MRNDEFFNREVREEREGLIGRRRTRKNADGFFMDDKNPFRS